MSDTAAEYHFRTEKTARAFCEHEGRLYGRGWEQEGSTVRAPEGVGYSQKNLTEEARSFEDAWGSLSEHHAAYVVAACLANYGAEDVKSHHGRAWFTLHGRRFQVVVERERAGKGGRVVAAAAPGAEGGGE